MATVKTGQSFQNNAVYKGDEHYVGNVSWLSTKRFVNRGGSDDNGGEAGFGFETGFHGGQAGLKLAM